MLAPALLQAVLLQVPGAAPGSKGLFQADVAALVAIAVVGAFAVDCSLRGALALLVLAALPAGVHWLLGGAFVGAPALAVLALGTAAAASGLAVLGRSIGAPRAAAGVVATAVLCTAMTGLRWADALAEHAAPQDRRTVRQAVLHVDLALACAYDAAGHDRLHDPEVYRHVPLAATLIERPTALRTGAIWMGVGFVCWGLGAVGARRSRRRAAASA